MTLREDLLSWWLERDERDGRDGWRRMITKRRDIVMGVMNE